MKLSCLPVSYFKEIINGDMSIGEWAHQAATIGLDAIDISIILFKNRSTAYLKKMREEIEDAGMHIAVMNTYPDFTHPDPVERKRQLVQLKRDIASANVLGAEMVRVTAGQAHPQTNRKQGIAWAIEGLMGAVDTSEREGVKLVFENHSKPGAWEYYDFCYPPDIFLEIAGRLTDTPIRILFDTANPVAYGHDPLSVLHQVIDQLLCVHAADTQTQGVFKPVLIGTGAVPFSDIFSVLKQSGYDGWISIEEASGLGETGVVEAVKFVRRAWKEAGGTL
ncbi:MAG: sugar phosphate isomerase/epimerase family protein [bacterium]|nr:sugar phosphate isomerase/epimerase family protein [bacterium]